jgi:hypothetical protein
MSGAVKNERVTFIRRLRVHFTSAPNRFDRQPLADFRCNVPECRFAVGAGRLLPRMSPTLARSRHQHRNLCRSEPQGMSVATCGFLQKISAKKIGMTIQKNARPGGLRVRAFAWVLMRGLKGFCTKARGAECSFRCSEGRRQGQVTWSKTDNSIGVVISDSA